MKSFPVDEAATKGVRIRWTPDGAALVYRGDPEGLWRQMLSEDTPRAVRGFESVPVRNFAWSADGRNLMYSSGPTTQEIILIDGFGRSH